MLLASIGGIGSALPICHINSTGSFFGSVSKDELITLIHYMVENNETAFDIAMNKGLSAGTIVEFNNSEPVYVMDHDYSVGLIQVRPQENMKLYWTVHEAVPGSWTKS